MDDLTQLCLFDYDALDDDTRAFVRQRTGEVKALMRQTAQGVIDIGVKLAEVKERLDHGRFLTWLEAEFNWGRTTAHRFLTVAERFTGKCSNLEHFAPSALYLLAAPSTPEAAREEALEAAGRGEPVSHAKAKEIINNHRPKPTVAEVLERQPEEDEGPSPTPRPLVRYPHSEAMQRWLDMVESFRFITDNDYGSLAARLAQRDGWNRHNMVMFLIPQLNSLREVLEAYYQEMHDAFEQSDGEGVR